MRLITILLFIFSSSFLEARTTIRNPEKMTPEQRRAVKLSAIAGRLRHGPDEVRGEMRHKVIYSRARSLEVCSFVLKRKTFVFENECKKTKKIEFKFRGETKTKTVSNCPKPVKQKENIKIDLKTVEVSPKIEPEGLKFKILVNNRDFYFFKKSHAEGLLKDLSQYKTKYCSK